MKKNLITRVFFPAFLLSLINATLKAGLLNHRWEFAITITDQPFAWFIQIFAFFQIYIIYFVLSWSYLKYQITMRNWKKIGGILSLILLSLVMENLLTKWLYPYQLNSNFRLVKNHVWFWISEFVLLWPIFAFLLSKFTHTLDHFNLYKKHPNNFEFHEIKTSTLQIIIIFLGSFFLSMLIAFTVGSSHETEIYALILLPIIFIGTVVGINYFTVSKWARQITEKISRQISSSRKIFLIVYNLGWYLSLILTSLILFDFIIEMYKPYLIFRILSGLTVISLTYIMIVYLNFGKTILLNDNSYAEIEMHKRLGKEYHCPSCKRQISKDVLENVLRKLEMFCPYCGTKLDYDNLFDISRREILSEHKNLISHLRET